MSGCNSILPRSLFLVIAAATLVLGPCFVNWYPNLRILEFSSSILAISISTAVPSCCLCWWHGEMSPKQKKRFALKWERSGNISVLWSNYKENPSRHLRTFALGFMFSFDHFYLDVFHDFIAWDISCRMTEPQRLPWLCHSPLGKPSRNPYRRETKRDSSSTLSCYLVVNFDLCQGFVLLQCINQCQNTGPSDEIGFYIQTLQCFVHFQHICKCLRGQKEGMRSTS